MGQSEFKKAELNRFAVDGLCRLFDSVHNVLRKLVVCWHTGCVYLYRSTIVNSYTDAHPGSPDAACHIAKQKIVTRNTASKSDSIYRSIPD